MSRFGFTHCCYTCEKTGGQSHGTRCQQDSLMEDAAAIDMKRYTDGDSIFEVLELKVEDYHPVRLLSMAWLLRHKGDVLPRRQELPEEAFADIRKLKHLWQASGHGTWDKLLPIIVVSFCWDTKQHPDPKALQISLIADTIEKHKSAFTDYGFTEMGIFWDWASLLQGDQDVRKAAVAKALEEGKSEKDADDAGWEVFRTGAEKKAFDHALHETMDLWYAHQGTTVLLLTQHPSERGSERKEGYDDSGWPTFERSSAEQIKKAWRWTANWDAVLDLGLCTNTKDNTRMSKRSGRRWPVGPADFDLIIDTKHFTNGANKATVKTLFRKLSRAQLGGVDELDFGGMPAPSLQDARRLGNCFALCANLKKLNLQGLGLTNEALQRLCTTLPRDALPTLKFLDLSCNHLGIDGMKAFAQATARGALRQLVDLRLHSSEIRDVGTIAIVEAAAAGSLPRLAELWLFNNEIGDDAVGALAEAAKAGRLDQLRSLRLGTNRFGDFGAIALGVAAKRGSLVQLRQLELERNQIGDDGAKELAQASRDGRLPRLAHLNLEYNRIGDAGARAIMAAIRQGKMPIDYHCDSLMPNNNTGVWLDGNPVGAPTVATLRAIGYKGFGNPTAHADLPTRLSSESSDAEAG